MTNNFFVLLGMARSALSCVWIETGDPAQPLVRVWIEREPRIALNHQDSQSPDQPLRA